MAVARVAGGGLDRVPDGVAEVQDLPDAGVALVARDDPQLGQRARRDQAGVGRIRVPADALPQLAAGDQRGLDDLGVAGGELGRRERLERRGVGDHGRRLVERADVVLGLGEVDAGLAAVGGVDLRDERRRHLHVAHAPLVGGGAEPGEVADDAAAERDHDVLARHPGPRQLGPHDLGVRDRLRLLAGHDRDPPDERLDVGRRRAGRRAPSVTRNRRPSTAGGQKPMLGQQPGPMYTG